MAATSLPLPPSEGGWIKKSAPPTITTIARKMVAPPNFSQIVQPGSGRTVVGGPAISGAYKFRRSSYGTYRITSLL
jgi:hypothetical protein